MSGQGILCIERAALERGLGRTVPTGLTTDPELFRKVSTLLLEEGKFCPRAAVEEDPAFLQPIVYGVISDGQRVLALWRKDRTASAGRYVETRHNRQIGLAAGGHVESFDSAPAFAKATAGRPAFADASTSAGATAGKSAGKQDTPADAQDDLFRAALLRELQEELVFTPEPPRAEHLRPVGILFRDKTVFDRVHIGLIFRVPVAGAVILPPASDEYDRIAFLSPAELPQHRDAMEGWGQILADAIVAGELSLKESHAMKEEVVSRKQ